METIALTHDLFSCYPFLINFSKLLLDPEVSFNRKLNRGLYKLCTIVERPM